MSRSAKIEMLVLDILADGLQWNTAEMRKIIDDRDSLLLKNSNLFYVVLNRMVTVKKTVLKNEDGTYEIREKAPETIRKEMNMCKEKIKECWEKCYDSMMADYNLSYDMSEQQFREGKRLYELNKKIVDMIQSYGDNSIT